MESVLSASDKQQMVSSFLEIAVGQSSDTARQFLQATSWKLEEAIQLYFLGNEGGAMTSFPQTETSAHSPEDRSPEGSAGSVPNLSVEQNTRDAVRPPLPVVRETLYDNTMSFGPRSHNRHEPSLTVAFRNFEEESRRPRVWDSDQGTTSTANAPRDNLASLYRPPFHLMFNGSFETAKATASSADKWLLVNLQSAQEFSSHMLNRDTWANEAVSQTISANFIFWQAYDDTTEGRKVCTYYKLDSIPVVLVIDPITGQKMRSWCGMVQPEVLLEDLVPFMDGGPRDHHVSLSNKRQRGDSVAPKRIVKNSTDVPNDEDEELQRALAASLENMNDTGKASSSDKEGVKPAEEEETNMTQMPSYPLLAEEPKGDRSLLCRVGVRLPCGRRVQRNFLRTDPIQLLWSFCYSQLEESERKRFKLTHAIPGASKTLDYNTEMTFGESGLNNSMISVAWE